MNERNRFARRLQKLYVERWIRRLLQRTGLLRADHTLFVYLHRRMLFIYGEQGVYERTAVWICETAGLSIMAAGMSILLYAASGEATAAFVGMVLAVLVPAARIRDLVKQAEERRRATIRELPDLLARLLLQVGAGEPPLSALMKCASSGDSEHPLYRELGRAMQAVKLGEPLQSAMDGFARRCGVQEAAVFTAVLLLNVKKGGDSFVLSVRELSYTLWERRKSLARTRGEEASAMLSFPLAIIFFVLMLLVGAPAMLSLSG